MHYSEFAETHFLEKLLRLLFTTCITFYLFLAAFIPPAFSFIYFNSIAVYCIYGFILVLSFIGFRNCTRLFNFYCRFVCILPNFIQFQCFICLLFKMLFNFVKLCFIEIGFDFYGLKNWLILFYSVFEFCDFLIFYSIILIPMHWNESYLDLVWICCSIDEYLWIFIDSICNFCCISFCLISTRWILSHFISVFLNYLN